MTWDDSAPAYPGYRLAFVVGDQPPYGQSLTLYVKVSAAEQVHDSVIGDLVKGMTAQGYRLYNAELSSKYWIARRSKSSVS